MTDNSPYEEQGLSPGVSAEPVSVTRWTQRVWDYVFLLSLAGLIVFFDQWTKGWVRTNLALGEIWAPVDWLAPYARIVHWQNTGAAFGMFKDFGIVFTFLAILVAGAILYYFPQVPRHDWYLRLAMGMQLGGALGNLIDRLTVGEVTDFVSLGNFPVFNVADASISTGVAILAIGMLIGEWKQRTPRVSDEDGESWKPVFHQPDAEPYLERGEPRSNSPES